MSLRSTWLIDQIIGHLVRWATPHSGRGHRPITLTNPANQPQS